MVEFWENYTSSIDTNQGELLALNDTTRELVGILEKSEWNIPKSEQKTSDFVRWVDFKIGSFHRNDFVTPEMKQSYDNLIEKYFSSIKKDTLTATEYMQLSNSLLKDLNALKTREWEIVTDKKVDSWFMEWLNTLYDWVQKWIEITIRELEEQLKMLVSPDEWKKIVDGLLEIAKNPIQFMELLMNWLKTEAKEVWKDVEIMRKNSTHSWFTAEVWKYIPETWIPILIWTIWIWKFLKIFKLEWLLWEKTLKSVTTLDLWREKWKYLVNKGELFWEFINKTEKFHDILTVEKLLSNSKNMSESIKILKSMAQYIIDHKETIPGMNINVRNQAKNNIERLVNKVWVIVDSDDLGLYQKEFKNVLNKELKDAYYILIPEWKPDKNFIS